MCKQRLYRRCRFSKDELILIFRSLTAWSVILYGGLALLGPPFLLVRQAYAQTTLKAEYVISFARITVGNAIVRADISDSAYAIFASGHAGGAMRLLADGDGNLTSRGSVTGNRLLPSEFMLKIDSATDPLDVNMTIEDGDVTELTVLPPGNPDDAPIADADRRRIVDPLTAVLVPADEAGDGLNRETCQRTLPIFDGRQRYDLQLDFKRFDKVTANNGYSGPVIVCSLSFRPIAGHRVSAPLVKYLSESRQIEIAFAPLAGTHLLAPYRLVVTNLLANLVVQANRFETSIETAPAPPKSNSNSP
jgi:Protein of unknown function (DUF3108)